MRKGTDPSDWKVVPLAAEHTVVHESPDPQSVYLENPSIVALPGGRIVAAFDQSGVGVRKLSGAKGRREHSKHWLQGRIYASADKGATWSFKQVFPFCSACLFRDGQRLYLLGHKGNLQIMRSDDGGETWGKPVDLTSKDGTGSCFVEGPVNALLHDGYVYLVAMKYAGPGEKMSNPALRAACILRGRLGLNLASKKSWTMAESGKPFNELVPQEGLGGFGIPFFTPPSSGRRKDVGGGRWVGNVGWSGAQCVAIPDPQHYLSDADGLPIYVVASAEAHRSNMAVLARVVDAEKDVSVELVKTPAGTDMAFLPMPGGNMRFSVLYDDETGLYWLLSNQVTDSMTDAHKLGRGRRGLPCEQWTRLALHFSRNMIDWCFAGYVAGSEAEKESRRSAVMAVRGKDLCIVCCAGDERCKDSHHANLIAFHSVTDFRELVY